MFNPTLSPIPLLERSLQLVSPIYGPLLVLASPGFVVAVVAEQLPSPIVGASLNLIYSLIAAPILTGAAFWLVDQHLRQQSPLLGNSLDRAVAKAVDLVVGSFLAGLLTALGLALLILPGIYWGMRLVFTPCAIALEDQRATGGLGYSWNLVRGRWWSVFWAFLAVGLILAVSFLILSFVVGRFAAALGLDVLTTVAVNALITAVVPVLCVYQVLLFRSLQQLSRPAAP